jgi:hypothetical protein
LGHKKGYKLTYIKECMVNKKELKLFLGYLRKVHKKSLIKKISKIEDLDEKVDLIKYSIKTKLEIDVYELEKEMKKKEDKGKDILKVSTMIKLLKSKIKLFEATYHKGDFNNIIKSFKEVKKELKHV